MWPASAEQQCLVVNVWSRAVVGVIVPLATLSRFERSARKSFDEQRGLRRQRRPAALRSTPFESHAALWVCSCVTFVAACSLEALQTL